MKSSMLKEKANELYYNICNTCVEFDVNEMPYIVVNDSNRESVEFLLGGIQDFLADIMFNRVSK